MFALFKASIETRLFPLIWPQPHDNAIEMCQTSEQLVCPPAAIQAATAIANLAIANDHCAQLLPADRARGIAGEMQKRLLARLAEDDAFHAVTRVLTLQDERARWQQETGMALETSTQLVAIIQPVLAMRLGHYRADMVRTKEAALSGEFHGQGPMGYVARRWLSQLSGRPVVHEEVMVGDDFAELGVASLYFTYKAREIAGIGEL